MPTNQSAVDLLGSVIYHLEALSQLYPQLIVAVKEATPKEAHAVLGAALGNAMEATVKEADSMKQLREILIELQVRRAAAQIKRQQKSQGPEMHESAEQPSFAALVGGGGDLT